MSLDAANPDVNATVFASAGTGKTWLLVTRLLRLLLAGARPGSILAITFTNRAAAEMQQRLYERLQYWACCDESELLGSLREIGLSPSHEELTRARDLYEELLLTPHPLRSKTFHAFCHDLLLRFPLEADMPPGFDLLEDAQALELQDLARTELSTEASRDTDGALAQALALLLQRCGTDNTWQILDSFLNQRSDWWAWTEDQASPLAFAEKQARQWFESVQDHDPVAALFSPHFCQQLESLTEFFLQDAAGKKAGEIGKTLQAWLVRRKQDRSALEWLCKLLLTDKGEAYKNLFVKKHREQLGEDVANHALETYSNLCQALLNTQDLLLQQDNLQLNLAWYRAGERYLKHYQQFKQQRRLLDFNDLEWMAYRLLNKEEDALWVQYRLDQRIDHLLIDEFQDTNPTQWRLLLPLLQEFASSAGQDRSVFLVGDEKQSIYAFRRANPLLQQHANNWLVKHLRGRQDTLTHSWRSSPAIIEAVNQVFGHQRFGQRLPGFEKHSTHLQSLWGRVEILPFCMQPETDAVTPFRNPLKLPRPDKADATSLEGRAIAQRIEELINSGLHIMEGNRSRPLQYRDIYIILRTRTHSKTIEQALRAAGIPFHGSSRGSLLMKQEIGDLRALLTILHTPEDNLALARVLRSPIFSVDHTDLLYLASLEDDHWWQRLATAAEQLEPSHILVHAHQQLLNWQEKSAALPLHDLLNLIFFQGNLLARYRAASPAWQRPQIEANLKRLIELALEIDSGRYPSLNHFLLRLGQLEQLENAAPSEPVPLQERGVEVMTIHAAKGLEAPVIFLANLARKKDVNQAWQAIVNWPAEAERPRHFLLQPVKAQTDRITREQIERWESRQETEEANLLYVAMTRARQMLILSASGNKSRVDKSDYAELMETLQPLLSSNEQGILYFERGTAEAAALSEEASTPVATGQPHQKPHPGLKRPLSQTRFLPEIAPSRADDESLLVSGDADGRMRGIAVHFYLEKLTSPTPWSFDAIRHRLAADLNMDTQDPRLATWLDEARLVIQSFPHLYLDSHESYNELPLLYAVDGRQVYGVVDRVICLENEIFFLDYKTHRLSSVEQAEGIANHFQQQLRYYQQGLQQLFPGRVIKAALLFTAIPLLLPLSLENH
jgi:ATP-dependent helicase/nuclease subunit A